MFAKDLKNDKEYILPLTELQKEMLFSISSDIYEFVERVNIRFDEKLDKDKFEDALRKLISIHPMLRCVFRWKNISSPIMIVLSEVNLPVYYEDIETEIDIENEPWNISISEDYTCLTFTYSHLIMDGWSLGCFFNQLFSLYSGNKINFETSNNAMRKYFVAMKKKDFSKEEQYWKSFWKGYSPLMLGDSFAGSLEIQGNEYKVCLEEKDYKELKFFASNEGVPISSILYLAWGILLGSYLRKNEICMGYISSGRNNELIDFESIGMFIKSLPLRISLDGDIKKLCQEVSKEILENSKYENASNQMIYNGSKRKLYDSLLVVENYPLDVDKMKQETGIGINSFDFSEDVSYPYVVQIQLKDKVEILITGEKSASYAQLKDLGDTYLYILKQLSNKSVANVSDIRISNMEKQYLCDFEKGTIYNTNNGNVTLPDYISLCCKANAVKIAIVDGASQITYQEIYENAKRVSVALRNKGVKNGTPVGIYMGRSAKMLLSVYSTLFAGGAYLPLSRSLPLDRINYIINNSETKVIICEKSTDKNDIKLDNSDVCIVTYDELLGESDGDFNNEYKYSCNDTAYIIYTSGTTGLPKGVEISHYAILNRLIWNSREIGLSNNDIQMFKTPISFDVSIIELFQIFFNEHKLVVLPETYEKMPDKIAEYINEFGVTYVHFVPSMFKQFIYYIKEMHQEELIGSITKIVCSGEVLHADVIKQFYELKNSQNVDVINLYGPTEAAVDVSSFLCPHNPKDEIIPIGKPIYNTELRILDNHKRRCNPYVVGELYILGDNLGKGYINDEKKTKESYFVLDDGKRCYYTGDLAYWDNQGDITVIGRGDSQIKYNGVRIECDEITNYLISNNVVKDAVIMLVKAGMEQLVLFFTGEEKTEVSLKQALKANFPEYMLPTRCCYVNEIPLTAHGKRDLKKLSEIYKIQIKDNSLQNAKECNLSENENKIAQIWRGLLGEFTDVISKESDFFQLGGNSLMIISMVTKIKKEFDVILSTAEVYNSSSLEDLATLIETKQELSSEEVVYNTNAINNVQKGIALYQLMNKESTAYNMPILIKLRPEVDIKLFHNAFLSMLQQDEYLRSAFVLENDELKRIILDYQLIPLKITEIEEDKLEQYCFSFVKPFAIDELMLRMEFLSTSQSKYVLFDIHHILCNQDILKAILENLISCIEGKEINKIELKPQVVNEKRYEDHKKYWMDNFSKQNESILLPKNRYSNNNERVLRHLKFELDTEIVGKVRRFSSNNNTTSFIVLLSAFMGLCWKNCEKEYITIGTNFINQGYNQNQIASLEVLPIKVNIDPKNSLKEIVQSTRQSFSNAVKNNMYSYNELIHDLQISGNGESNPLFEMMFVKEENLFKDDLSADYFEYVENINKTGKFDLSLFYKEYDNSIVFSFDYNSNEYDRETVEFFAEAYQEIIKAMINDSTMNIKNVQLLSLVNQEKYYSACFGKRKQLDNKCIQRIMIETAKRIPNQIAIIDGDKQVTYRELDISTNIVANSLSKYGVKNNGVIISMSNSDKLLMTIFGVMKAGGYYIPVDNSFPEDRKKKILFDSKAVLCICETKADFIDSANCVLVDQLLDSKDDAEVCVENINSTVYCIYTSGSTGNPKGCKIRQRELLNYIDWANDFYCSGMNKTFAFYTSPAVDMSITSTVLPLVYGHTIVVYPNQVDSILNVVQDDRIQIIKSTPSHLSLINETIQVASQIETFIVGGENLHSKVARNIYYKFDKKVHIYNEYGPTECVVGCMIYEYNENDNLGSVPIGKPIQNMFTVVLDENKNMCMPYVKGELYIGGYGVIQGYNNNEELTCKKFIENTIDSAYSEKMYASGDIARIIDNGNLECFGRNDNQVKINGRRIELGDIAAAATKLEGINQAVALYNEEKKGISLFYEITSKKKWKEIELRKELCKYIPYYMMPVQIVSVDNFPLSKSGKIDTKKLLNIKWNTLDVVSSNEVKAYITQCVTEVLGHDKFTENDGFFEIGLNSLSIHSVHKLISKKYDIDVMDLFRYPSIESLTSYISDYDEAQTENRHIYEEEGFAIVGIGFQVRGAENLADLRNVFVSGKSMISYPTGQRYEDVIKELRNKGYSDEEYKMGMNASLERIDLFDPSYFKLGKDEANVLDPIQRLFMMNATKALYDAGFTKKALNGSKTGVICATPTPSGYTEYIEEFYPQYAEIAKLNKAHSIMLTRLQHYYNLTGPSFLVDSACSSGLVAMNEACKQLLSGACDSVLVGGVNLIELADVYDQKRAAVLSNSFHAETFSDTANGTARGEGCICYVVKRLSDAIDNRDKIYAVIRGMAMNNDGFSSSITAPNGNAQKAVICDAMQLANVLPEDIGVVETHGTATSLGDPIEVQALTEVYSSNDKVQQFCALSASKAVYGHMDSISGLMGLLKCIVSLKYKEIYSNFQVIAPNRRIDFMNSPFYVPNSVRKWEKNKKGTRYCGINNFGLSGTNVHMIIQQWPLESDQISGYDIKPKFFENVERCWIEIDSEITSSARKYAASATVITEKITLEEVQEELINKVVQLFPGRKPDIYEDLYSLGFDSISIIQLQQYIKTKYNLDIDIAYFFERLNTLELLSNYIIKEFERGCINKPDNRKLEEETYILKTATNQNGVITIKTYDTTPAYSEYLLKSFMNEFSSKYMKNTQKSYEIMSKDKVRWANGRFILGKTKGLEELSYPIIIEKAKGTNLIDVDGNEYLDFAMGFGANFFGYNNTRIQEAVKSTLDDEIVLGAIRPEPFSVAQKISEMTGVERVSFCNSGSEAIMNILRIARAATGRKKIITFKGSFHGTFDPVFTQANETGDIRALPKSIGTPMEYVSQTLMFPYGQDDVFEYLDQNYSDVAAIVVEPVQSRHPELRPKEFLKKLRQITEELGILLVFDEVITGFRSGIKGAQGHYGIEADLVSYGKVIGGGYPIGVFAGKSKYMDFIDHKGWSEVSQNENSGYLVNTGGTFNAHPVSIAAANEVCKILQNEGEEIYTRVNGFADYLSEELNKWFDEENIEIKIEHFKSQFIFVSPNVQMLRLMQYLLINNNIYVWEGGTCFVSTEHTKEQIDYFIKIVKQCGMVVKNIFCNEHYNVKISKHICINEKIEKVLNEYKNVEKIYPMTKQQISVMTSNLNNHNKKLDVSYMIFDYRNTFEEDKLQEAFIKTVNDYEELRSIWIWRGVKNPVRAVLNNVYTEAQFYYTQNITNDLIDRIIDKRKTQGFPLKKAPYLALDIVTDGKISKIILSFYTSIVDGWSIDLFLETLMENYLGKEVVNNQFDYERYLDWIFNYDDNRKTELFWKEYLNGYNPEKNRFVGEINEKMETYIWKLDSNDVSVIQNIIKKASCSMASVLLYCYGKAINKCAEDCLVASTITGRNMSIPGMFEAVGMFSNIIPLRIRGNNHLDAIKDIELVLKRVNQLVPVTIEEIADFADISLEVLRETITTSTLVILNQSNQNKVDEMKMVEDHGYIAVPLRTYATVNDSISLLFTYNAKNVNSNEIERIIAEFRRILNFVL